MSESNLDLIAKRKPESIGFLNFGASVYLLASVIAGIYFFVATGYSDLMTWYMRWVGVGVLANGLLFSGIGFAIASSTRNNFYMRWKAFGENAEDQPDYSPPASETKMRPI